MEETGPKRQKILFLITKSNWGGAQKYVFDLATNLPKDRYEVEVVLGGNGQLKDELRKNNIPVTEIQALKRDINLKNEFKVLLEIINIIKTKKPDILHLNSSKVSGLGSFAGRFLNVKKTIFTAHGWAFNEDRSKLSKIIIKSAYLLTLWFANETIAVSNMLLWQIKNWPISKKKLHVIHNGIAKPNFIEKNEARDFLIKKIKEKLPTTELNLSTSDEVLWFGSIGELHHIKGQIYAIRAFAEIAKHRPSLKFIFTIISEGDIRQELENEISRLGLKNKVFLPGHIKDAVNYLRAFDYYIFPSLSEGLAYAILEAGSAKLPVIASNVGGIPEIISNGQNGCLVESKNARAIEETIYKYVDNPEIAQKYAEALYHKVSTQFSVDEMVRKTIQIYEK